MLLHRLKAQNRITAEKKPSNNNNPNVTYFNLITKMLNTRATSFLIECIFDKYKEIVETQNSLSFSDFVSLNLNTRTSDENLKTLLLRHFKHLKFECNQTSEAALHAEKSFRTREQPPAKLISPTNKEATNTYDEYGDSQVREDSSFASLFRINSSSFVVLNYSTIFWCFLVLVISILFLSVLFAYFIIKLQQKKREQKMGTKQSKSVSPSVFSSIRKKIFKLLNRLTGDDSQKSGHEATQSNSQTRAYNKHQHKYLLDNPNLKLKSKKQTRLKTSVNHKSSVFSNVNSESTRSSSIESSCTKIYDETSSEACSNKTPGYFHSHVWEKDFFQLKTEGNSTEEPVYDLFLVYNKADRELVENVIAPILQGRPYNYKISLQHNANTSGNLASNATQELIAWSHHQNRSDYYNLNLVEQFIDLINASSFVLFVLSKNLFTELEYRLSIETPKHKKLVLLADDIHDSIAENLLQPGQIFRGNFRKSDVSRKGICFEESGREPDTQILKLSNRLGSSESHHQLYNKQFGN